MITNNNNTIIHIISYQNSNKCEIKTVPQIHACISHNVTLPYPVLIALTYPMLTPNKREIKACNFHCIKCST